MLGLASYILYAIFGGTKTDTVSIGDFIFMMICGALESLGMVASIYAASIGIAGIAFGLANTGCIYVMIYNYLVRSQPITGA